MAAILALLTGPLGKWIGLAALAAVIAAGAVFAVHAHDSAVRATLLANQAAAQAKVDTEQHQRIVVVLGKALSEQRASAEQSAAIKEAIANAPDSQACLESAAIRAAVRGLFNDAPTVTVRPGLSPNMPASTVGAGAK